MKIRKATLQDLEALTELHLTKWFEGKEKTPLIRALIKEELLDSINRKRVMVAVNEKGNIVHASNFELVSELNDETMSQPVSAKNPRFYYVQTWVGDSPANKNAPMFKPIKELFNAHLDNAKKNGFESIAVAASNQKHLKAYKALGFKEMRNCFLKLEKRI